MDSCADGVAIRIVGQRRGVLLCAADVLGRGFERAQAAEVVGDIGEEARVEPGDLEAGVVLLGAFIIEAVGGIQGADVPDERLCGVFIELAG